MQDIIEYCAEQRRQTKAAQDEAESILKEADEEATTVYQDILATYQDRAEQYKEDALNDADERLETVRKSTNEAINELDTTQEDLDDHAATIAQMIHDDLNDNTGA